jgi:hypothetical protein
MTPAGRARLVRLVREWLGIDDILEVDKDSTAYPTYASHHDAMAAESISFIEEVIAGGSRLRDLLGAEWSSIDTASGATSAQITSYYTAFYGLDPDRIDGGGRVSLSAARGGPRVGILNQGAFLSQFATATASHPVKRGVALMRRLACLEPLDPGALNINVVPPVPDPRVAQTTRALYAAHASDPVCKGCHQSIDNFGFAFEAYDGMGAYRPNGQEAVKTTRGRAFLVMVDVRPVPSSGSRLRRLARCARASIAYCPIHCGTVASIWRSD